MDGPWQDDTLTYGYDDLGRRTTLTPQGGTALSYVYDRLNRLTTIQAGSANHVYAYTGVNPLVQSLTRPNGSTTSYQYNGENQLTEILNKTSTDDVLNQHVFTYNTLDLRGSETISGSVLPAMPSLPEETRDYAYNTVNQLLSVTNPNLTFVYDDDGNMTQGYINPLLGGAGVGFPFTATYDAEDRMTSLEYTDSSSVLHRTEYSYSGDGFLAEIRKYENSVLVDTVRIVRDGFLAVQDRDGNNNVVREYTWGLNLGGGIGGLLNLKQGGQDYAYLYDGKGNVAAVIDSSQAVVAAYRYAPFGELLAKTGSLTQPFGFSTKRYDGQTGLIHYQFRNYAPAIGRWTTRDPLGEAGGMNLYAFVGNNPVNWVDPWGLWFGVDDIFTGPADEIMVLTAILAYLASPPGQELQRNFIDSTTAAASQAANAAAQTYAAAADVINQGINVFCEEETPKKERSKHPPARRKNYSSKKDAREAAKRAGKGKKPTHHPHGKHGPHYHPDVPKPEPDQVTPKMPNPHDHYYYPKSKL